MVKVLFWKVKQLCNGWDSICDRTHGWLRIEDILFCHSWSNKLSVIQILGFENKNVLLWSKGKITTLDENVSSTGKGCIVDSVWYLRLEVSTLGYLELLLSVSDTF